MLRLPRFRYLHPATVADAVAMKADAGPDSSFVAGGTDLYPNMKRRQQTPSAVIGLGRLEELQGVTFGGEGAVMGAGVLLS
ncbi:MAG TPA: FAD binding domain-containing protein, partial [Thermoanaerobaculia bacterium]|nr:FAD binding domain-containing protein [Thermoanaerobaculia bacterium]